MTIPAPEGWARVRAMSYVYADACERGYVDFLSLSRMVSEYGDVEFDEGLNEAKAKKQIAGIQTIVFGAMCFEAAIYDFASIHLGDSYVREHLDKLDLLSKWVVILRFVAGYELEKGQAPYASLKRLIIARNNLVHIKSEAMDFENLGCQMEKITRQSAEMEADVHNAYRALVLMSLQLSKELDRLHPLPTFDSKVITSRVIPASLRNIVDECRQIVSRIGIKGARLD